MIVVTNRVPVAADDEFDFEDRFRRRVHLIDRAPGFIRNVVHRPRPVRFDHESGVWADDPTTPGCYEIKTWRRSFEDFVAWADSPAFAEAYSNRQPKETFAGPSKLVVREAFLSPGLEDR